MNSANKRLTAFKERHWDMLLEYIRQGRVVPVVGPELLVARDDEGRSIPFYQAAAARLAREMELFPVEGESLDDLVVRMIHENKTMAEARIALRRVLREFGAEPQPALDQLVGVKAFRLFLTTTPDGLLSAALNAADGGAGSSDTYFFSSNYIGCADLPEPRLPPKRRAVYHLYGRAAVRAEYALSEDERLRYSCLWMDGERRPDNLIEFLADKYLLILGCSYENWLARFFLFGLKGDRLFANVWDASSLLADSKTPEDGRLDSFLSRCRGNIYFEGGAAEFTNELVRRLGRDAEDTLDGESDNAFETDSVFVSYASEDREAALAVKRRLESFGFPVWLDLSELKSGDAYDAKIARNIRKASFFLPLLSRTTNTTLAPRYFRREWALAEKEAGKRSPLRPFVHPVAIDDVKPDCENLPDFLNALQWISAPGGALPDAALDHLVELAEKA